jgi:hypothetical protein
MTEELTQLRYLEGELAEADVILPLLAAQEFNQAKQKLDRVTEAIVTLRTSVSYQIERRHRRHLRLGGEG